MAFNQSKFLVSWSVLMAIVCYFLFYKSEHFLDEGTPLATLVTNQKNPVNVRSLNQLNFSNRKSGSRLYQSDIVSTPANSKAQIIFDDGRTLKLGPGTQIKIKPKSFVSNDIGLTLLKGSVDITRGSKSDREIILTAGNKVFNLNKSTTGKISFNNKRLKVSKSSGNITMRDNTGKASRLKIKKIDPAEKAKQIKVPKIVKKMKAPKKSLKKLKLRKDRKKPKKPLKIAKIEEKPNFALIKDQNKYNPIFNKKRRKYIIYNSLDNVKNIDFPIDIEKPKDIPENTVYTLGITYESSKKAVSEFFDEGNKIKSFTLFDIMYAGLISDDKKRMSFKLVPGFKLEDTTNSENEEEYWSKSAKPYTFIQLSKFRSYQLLFTQFSKGKNVEISDVENISSPIVTLNTKDPKVGIKLAQYGGGKPVQIKGSVGFSDNGIFLIKNHKIVAEIKTSDSSKYNWNQIRVDADVNVIIEGARKSYLGGKNAVSIKDILDENKDIRYLHRGEIIALDRGLLKQHKSARQFLKKFNSDFLIDGVKILSSDH